MLKGNGGPKEECAIKGHYSIQTPTIHMRKLHQLHLSIPQVRRLLQSAGGGAAMLDYLAMFLTETNKKKFCPGNENGRGETERSKPGMFNNWPFLRQTNLIEHDRGLDRSWSNPQELNIREGGGKTDIL